MNDEVKPLIVGEKSQHSWADGQPYPEVDKSKCEWPEYLPMPHQGDVPPLVRVVVENRQSYMGRYCFTWFPVDVSLKTMLDLIRDLKIPIDVTCPNTVIDVETRTLDSRNRYSPWALVKRLMGPEPLPLILYGTPVLKDGQKVGECGESQDKNGKLVVDMTVKKDAMPPPPGATSRFISGRFPLTTEKVCDGPEFDGLKQEMEKQLKKQEELATGRVPNIPDGPAKFLRLLLVDAQWHQDKRAQFMADAKLLADAIESGRYVFDPFVLSLIRAGIVARMKEYNW